LQSQESAADAAAVKFLEKANMSGKGLVDFFYNFRNYEIFSKADRYEFFRTHPLSRERIQALDKRVKEQPHYMAVDPPEVVLDFEISKAKLAGFLNDPIKTYKQYPLSDTSYPARYARILADYKMSKWDEALAALDAMIAEAPQNPYLWELKGQIYFETGRAALAVPAHQKSVELMPDAPLLRLNLAQALLNTGNRNDLITAIDQLKQAQIHEPDGFSWSLTAQAYDGLGQAGLARLATAESQFYNGDYVAARTSAVWSQKYFNESSVEFRRARDIVLATSSYLGIDAVEKETPRRKQ
jgi:predicted Zn-dependent protease